MQATEDLIRLCSSAAQPDQVLCCLQKKSLNTSISLLVQSVKRDMGGRRTLDFGGNTGKSFIFCWYDAIIYALNYSRNKVILESDCYVFGEMTDYMAWLWFHCSGLFFYFSFRPNNFFLSFPYPTSPPPPPPPPPTHTHTQTQLTSIKIIIHDLEIIFSFIFNIFFFLSLIRLPLRNIPPPPPHTHTYTHTNTTHKHKDNYSWFGDHFSFIFNISNYLLFIFAFYDLNFKASQVKISVNWSLVYINSCQNIIKALIRLWSCT